MTACLFDIVFYREGTLVRVTGFYPNGRTNNPNREYGVKKNIQFMLIMAMAIVLVPMATFAQDYDRLDVDRVTAEDSANITEPQTVEPLVFTASTIDEIPRVDRVNIDNLEDYLKGSFVVTFGQDVVDPAVSEILGNLGYQVEAIHEVNRAARQKCGIEVQLDTKGPVRYIDRSAGALAAADEIMTKVRTEIALKKSRISAGNVVAQLKVKDDNQAIEVAAAD